MILNEKIKFLILIIILYLESSIGEVIIHKYFMHNKEGTIMRKIYGDMHINHHLDVLDDMKLKYNFSNQGLYFSISDSLYVSILTFIIWYPTIRLFGYNIREEYIFILTTILGFIYKFTWDFLHYSFHQINELEKFKGSKLFNWLFINHSLHHLIKGKKKGNYNILFPGGDHLLGTYNTCIDNKEYCKNPHPSHKQFCNDEKNQVEIKHGLKWCDN